MRTMNFDGDDIWGFIGGSLTVLLYSLFHFNPETHPIGAFFEGTAFLLASALKFALLAIIGGFLGKLGKDLYDAMADMVRSYFRKNK
jgi:hypothetical protein